MWMIELFRTTRRWRGLCRMDRAVGRGARMVAAVRILIITTTNSSRASRVRPLEWWRDNWSSPLNSLAFTKSTRRQTPKPIFLLPPPPFSIVLRNPKHRGSLTPPSSRLLTLVLRTPDFSKGRLNRAMEVEGVEWNLGLGNCRLKRLSRKVKIRLRPLLSN